MISRPRSHGGPMTTVLLLSYNAAVLFLIVVGTSQAALQLSNDPASYFGGSTINNDDINSNQAYVNWANSISSRYDSSVYLPSMDDASNGAAIHWRIVDDEWLHIAVAAKATGWIGFGLAEAGGMLGSDMALFVKSRPSEIVDAHVVESFFPETDDCQQDWILVNNSNEDDGDSSSSSAALTTRQAVIDDLELSGFLAFEARRKLITNDPQDKQIINDAEPAIPPHRLIAAWGDTPEVSYHGTKNVARGAIRFYDALEDPQAAFDQTMETNAEGSFVVQATNFTIPAKETRYVTFCLTRSDLLKQGVPDVSSDDLLNVIGFQPVLSPESAPYVHHFLVYGSYDGSDNACEDAESDILAYAWAPGDGAFALPDFLGAPLFGPDGFQSFNMEVHYNNPRLDRGVVDSSGVELFYTSQAREFELGILQVGDPSVELFGSPVGEGLTSHSFDCPGSCSSFFVKDDEPVTVVREHLHMHEVGTRITNEQIRNGEVVRSGSIEVWEFDQNGNAPVIQEPYQVFPGDGFRTTCYYRGSDRTEFGLGSKEEMCIGFLYYYPRKSVSFDGYSIPWICGLGFERDGLSMCSGTHEQSSLEQDHFMNREFGEPECLATDDGSRPEESPPASSATSRPNAKLFLHVLAAGVFYFFGQI